MEYGTFAGASLLRIEGGFLAPLTRLVVSSQSAAFLVGSFATVSDERVVGSPPRATVPRRTNLDEESEILANTHPRQLRPINRPRVTVSRLVRSLNPPSSEGRGVEHTATLPPRRRFALSHPVASGGRDALFLSRMSQSEPFIGSSRGRSHAVSDASPEALDDPPETEPLPGPPEPPPARGSRPPERGVSRLVHTLNMGCGDPRRIDRSPGPPSRVSGAGSWPTFADDGPDPAEPAPGSRK
jgi:hypothetical protein